MQRLGCVLVALESCDGIGDDGVGGEVLESERGSQSSCCFMTGKRRLLRATYVQELRVMDLLAVDSYFSHGCFLCVRHQVNRDLERVLEIQVTERWAKDIPSEEIKY